MPNLLYHWPRLYPKLVNATSYRKFFLEKAIYGTTNSQTVRPIISIITVCYNSGASLERTIQSVWAQNNPNLEHIIIDGNSTDSTRKIIEKYKDNFSYYKSNADLGIYDAMNQGLLCAEGDYIAILNADDYLELGAAQIWLDSFHRTNADYLYGPVLVENQAAGKSYVDFGAAGQTSINENWFYHHSNIPFPHPSLVVKKQVYERIGLFRLDLKLAADTEMIRRILFHHYKGVALSQAYVHFRLAGASVRAAEQVQLENLTLRLELYNYRNLNFYLYHLIYYCKKIIFGVPGIKYIRFHPRFSPLRRKIKATMKKILYKS